jgi:hypothetical protein
LAFRRNLFIGGKALFIKKILPESHQGVAELRKVSIVLFTNPVNFGNEIFLTKTEVLQIGTVGL